MLYNAGLLKEMFLKEKSRCSIEDNWNQELIEKFKDLCEKENSVIDKLKIQLAKDDKNIIWDYYTEKKSYRSNYKTLAGIFAASILFFVSAFFSEYFMTKRFFELIFIYPTEGFPVTIGGFETRMDGLIISLIIINICWPVLGYEIL